MDALVELAASYQVLNYRLERIHTIARWAVTADLCRVLSKPPVAQMTLRLRAPLASAPRLHCTRTKLRDLVNDLQEDQIAENLQCRKLIENIRKA